MSSQFPHSTSFIFFLHHLFLLKTREQGIHWIWFWEISWGSGDGMAHFRAGPGVWLWRAVTWPVAHFSTLFGLARQTRSSRVAGRLELNRLLLRLLCCLTARQGFCVSAWLEGNVSSCWKCLESVWNQLLMKLGVNINDSWPILYFLFMILCCC